MTKRKARDELDMNLVQSKRSKEMTISLLSDNDEQDIAKYLMPESPKSKLVLDSFDTKSEKPVLGIPALENYESPLSRHVSFDETSVDLGVMGGNLGVTKLLDNPDHFPELVDFTVKQDEFKSQECLVSSNGIVFHSDLSSLLKNDGVKVPFAANIVNLLLNFIHFKKFDYIVRNNREFKMSMQTTIDLWKCAIHFSLPDLEKLCAYIFDVFGDQINEAVNQLYTEREYNKEYLYERVITGKITFDADLSKQFLSDCFDFGFEHKQIDGLILNVIPWYIMSDDQMRRFRKINGYDSLQCQNKDTMKRFLEYFKKNPTPGSIRLLYRIAELRYG